MNTLSCRADLHVHSRYSHRPTSWILQKVGCAESYTHPSALYRILRRRGMDLVTITDHNTLDGCLQIGHLENTFLSEEVTAYFPEDQCKVHVLVYDITERQHQDLTRVRKNLFELVDYVNAEGIQSAVAHPLYSINGKLTPEHVEKLLLLFEAFELNGARDPLQNTAVRRIVASLTPERIAALAERHDFQPRGFRPWKKRLISGSDDHSSLYLGLSYTAVSGASTVSGFLKGIERGCGMVNTHPAQPETLAHNVYSIMYQFYDESFHIKRRLHDSELASFLEASLRPSDPRPARSPSFTSLLSRKRGIRSGASLTDPFLKDAAQTLFADPSLADHLRGLNRSAGDQGDVWLEFVHRVSGTLLQRFAHDLLSRLSQADLFSLFGAFSSSASLYLMLSPYYIAYSLFARDRAFSLACLESQGAHSADLKGPARSVAAFTDTFHEINGVATAIRSQVEAARKIGKSFTLILCDPERRQEPNVAAFEPIDAFELPEYPELKVFTPPVLRLVSYCYRQRFTHIHAETPGAMGLTALAVSRMLNLPFRGTYHTSLPQTVGALTRDAQIEELFWKYVLWFYGQMERIYVPSAMTARELTAKGLPADKIVVHPWGVDTRTFHPDKRNGFFRARFRIREETLKLLYVGRVSEEKNLGVFETMMRKIHQVRDDVHLIIVGEGPYLRVLQEVLAGLPVTFTGYLAGEDLAQAYASSDLFVFPSTVDTMGNVVVEAQASGVPVIVTDRGGPCENMIDQETGLVVPADGRLPDRFAEAVLHLGARPERLDAMRKNARHYTANRSCEMRFLDFWNRYG